MAKGNTKCVIHLDDKLKNKNESIHKRAKRTIKENLWDSSWLVKKYPNRFDGLYEKWELGDDVYDPALFPDRFINEAD
tara:strand:- start:2694 stop:2927 length:234 start_codon:yes stop_codon:yes gene_type:complete